MTNCSMNSMYKIKLTATLAEPYTIKPTVKSQFELPVEASRPQ